MATTALAHESAKPPPRLVVRWALRVRSELPLLSDVDTMTPTADTTATVLLKRKGVLHLNEGHPWIFAQHVATDPLPPAGVVRLEGPEDRARGWAVCNPGSKIPLRVISRDVSVEFEADWWEQRLDASIARRTGGEALGGAPACRWVHAESDGLPGLVVDRYDTIAVVQAGCRWADGIVWHVAQRLIAQHGITGVLARHDGGFRKPEGLELTVEVLAGEVPREVKVRIGEIDQVVDLWEGQKTGTFLDQRENAPWAAKMLVTAPDVRCLDVCTYRGGFALHLAAAGAIVDALDSSRPALDVVAATAAMHGLEDKIRTVKGSAFDALRMLGEDGERYSGIIVDPPALAKRRGDLTRAMRAYKDMNLRAIRLLEPGGQLVSCSCSAAVSRDTFLTMLGSAASDSQRELDVVEIRGAASCHPFRPDIPESAYLKVVLLRARD